MSYAGPERRKEVRIPGSFVAYYTVPEDMHSVNMSLIKNISLRGILLNIDKKLSLDTEIILSIRLPSDLNPVVLMGKVRDSREVLKDMVYETRIEFINLDDKQKEVINQVVDYYLKKSKS